MSAFKTSTRRVNEARWWTRKTHKAMCPMCGRIVALRSDRFMAHKNQLTGKRCPRSHTFANGYKKS